MIRYYENKDRSEIINFDIEKNLINLENNRIVANKLIEKLFEEYLDIRLKIGLKRMKLYKDLND